MDLLLQQLFNGVVLGMTYGLVASGLSLIFGIMGVLNFAHGELYMIGAYITMFLTKAYGLSYVWGGLIAVGLVVIISFVLERVAIGPILNRDYMSPFLSSFALSIILANLIQYVFGANPKRLPSPFEIPIEVKGLILTQQKILIIVCGIAVILALNLVIKSTKIGKILRATSQNVTAASLVGINSSRTYMYAFGIAGGLAALSGILLAPLINLYPTMGSTAIIKGFIVVVLGGLGSISGAVIGGLLLGSAEVITATFFGSGWKDVVGYIILIAILIWKPTGLFGKTSD